MTVRNTKAPHNSVPPTAPHRTATAQHSTAQHSTAPHRTAPHRTAPHRTAPHRTAPHRTAPCTCVRATHTGVCSSVCQTNPCKVRQRLGSPPSFICRRPSSTLRHLRCRNARHLDWFQARDFSGSSFVSSRCPCWRRRCRLVWTTCNARGP